jgi:hypothetical protein
METTIKSLTRKLEDLSSSAKQGGGIATSGANSGSLSNENHPEVLMEQVKKLKKENTLLK